MKSNQIKQVKYISTFNGGLAALFGLMILTGGVIATNSASVEVFSTTGDVSDEGC